MNKLFLPIIGMLLISTIAFSGCIQEGTGTLVLKITDAPSELNITEALVTISEVRVHRAGIDNETNDTGYWFTIVNTSQTFDLIAIQNVTEFFGSANLSAGVYTQIRLYVESALVTIDGIQYNLTIPSKNVKLIHPFIVEANETITLIMDFDVHKSVHEASNEKYIFKPTIKIIQE